MPHLAQHDDHSTSAAPAPFSIGLPLTLIEIIKTNPVFEREFFAFGEALRKLEDRLRELATLRVSVLLPNDYIWAGHGHIALDRGLSVDDIARAAVGPQAMEGRDAAILQLVDDRVARRDPREATLSALGEADAVAITVVVHFYELVAALVRDAAPEADATPIPGLPSAAEAHAALRPAA